MRDLLREFGEVWRWLGLGIKEDYGVRVCLSTAVAMQQQQIALRELGGEALVEEDDLIRKAQGDDMGREREGEEKEGNASVWVAMT